MSKEDLIRKLTSRKFWTAVCGFIALLVVAIGHTETEASQVTALIMAGATVLSYIIGEGLIDAARTGESYQLPDVGEEEEEEE